MQIRWGRSYSSLFSVANGVRQGSILSSYFFAVYINDVSKKLNKMKVGCFVGNLLLTIYYLLMICAVFALVFMVFNISFDVCHSYASFHNINIQLLKNTRLIFCI